MMLYDDIYEEIAAGTAAASLPGWACRVVDDYAGGRSPFAAVRHPLGFLCLPVERWQDLGVCLHIWSPDVPPVSATTSLLHCHSWELVSFVLYGTVRNVRASVVDAGSPGATHRVFEVISSGDVDELRATRRTVQYSLSDAATYRTGETYSLPAGSFHSTLIDNGQDAATVALGRQRPHDRDLSLGPLDTPTHRFHRPRCDLDAVAGAARRFTRRITTAYPSLGPRPDPRPDPSPDPSPESRPDPSWGTASGGPPWRPR